MLAYTLRSWTETDTASQVYGEAPSYSTFGVPSTQQLAVIRMQFISEYLSLSFRVADISAQVNRCFQRQIPSRLEEQKVFRTGSKHSTTTGPKAGPRTTGP